MGIQQGCPASGSPWGIVQDPALCEVPGRIPQLSCYTDDAPLATMTVERAVAPILAARAFVTTTTSLRLRTRKSLVVNDVPRSECAVLVDVEAVFRADSCKACRHVAKTTTAFDRCA